MGTKNLLQLPQIPTSDVAPDCVLATCWACTQPLFIAANSLVATSQHFARASVITALFAVHQDGDRLCCRSCLRRVGRESYQNEVIPESPHLRYVWELAAIVLKAINGSMPVLSRPGRREGDSVSGSGGGNPIVKSTPDCHEQREVQVLKPDSQAACCGSSQLTVTLNELRQNVQSLRSEISSRHSSHNLSISTATVGHASPRGGPEDGYELIATALREIQTKAAEVNRLACENRTLRSQVQALRSSAHRFGASEAPLPQHPDPPRKTITMHSNATSHTGALNPGEKRAREPSCEEIDAAVANDASFGSPTPRRRRLSPPDDMVYHAKSTTAPTTSTVTINETGSTDQGAHSEDDELAHPPSTPKQPAASREELIRPDSVVEPVQESRPLSTRQPLRKRRARKSVLLPSRKKRRGGPGPSKKGSTTPQPQEAPSYHRDHDHPLALESDEGCGLGDNGAKQPVSPKLDGNSKADVATRVYISLEGEEGEQEEPTRRRRARPGRPSATISASPGSGGKPTLSGPGDKRPRQLQTLAQVEIPARTPRQLETRDDNIPAGPTRIENAKQESHRLRQVAARDKLAKLLMEREEAEAAG